MEWWPVSSASAALVGSGSAGSPFSFSCGFSCSAVSVYSCLLRHASLETADPMLLCVRDRTSHFHCQMLTYPDLRGCTHECCALHCHQATVAWLLVVSKHPPWARLHCLSSSSFPSAHCMSYSYWCHLQCDIQGFCAFTCYSCSGLPTKVFVLALSSIESLKCFCYSFITVPSIALSVSIVHTSPVQYNANNVPNCTYFTIHR